MKSIPFKTSPRYSQKFRSQDEIKLGSYPILPTKHFVKNFTAEQAPGRGLKGGEVAMLDAGITVIHQKSEGKLIKHLIQRAYGKGITSTKPAMRSGSWKRRS